MLLIFLLLLHYNWHARLLVAMFGYIVNWRLSNTTAPVVALVVVGVAPWWYQNGGKQKSNSGATAAAGPLVAAVRVVFPLSLALTMAAAKTGGCACCKSIVRGSGGRSVAVAWFQRVRLAPHTGIP